MINDKFVKMTEDEVLEKQRHDELELQRQLEEEQRQQVETLQAEIDKAYEEAKVVDPLYDKINELKALINK